jgi:endonuclease YncB( thermonuclease family)
MLRRLLPLLAVLTTVLGLAPAAHASWRAPCAPGSSGAVCTFWTAKVVFVADGDTIRVRIDGDPGRPVRTIRFTGINAMELTRYSSTPRRRRGACHALAATALVDRAVRASHGVVRLAAQRASSRSGHRLRRSVWARVGGRWQDLGRLEAERGLALWLPNGTEYAHNLEYRRLAQDALAARRGMYDPRSCGAGPDDDVPLEVSVNWDADGDDAHNLNGEWVEVRNRGARDISLRGWWVRDSWLNYGAGHVPGYPFPAWAHIAAGGAIRVHVGCGNDTATDLHWCQRTSAFENITYDKRHMGDGGYLFDPQGDLRASMIYPCAAPCHDPLQGQIRVDVHPTTPEWIAVRNVGAGSADLGGYVLKLHAHGRRDAFIWGVPFTSGTTLAPGQALQLWMEGAPRSAGGDLVRDLGKGSYVLADGGNSVSLRSADDALVACTAWGRARC